MQHQHKTKARNLKVVILLWMVQLRVLCQTDFAAVLAPDHIHGCHQVYKEPLRTQAKGLKMSTVLCCHDDAQLLGQWNAACRTYVGCEWIEYQRMISTDQFQDLCWSVSSRDSPYIDTGIHWHNWCWSLTAGEHPSVCRLTRTADIATACHWQTRQCAHTRPRRSRHVATVIGHSLVPSLANSNVIAIDSINNIYIQMLSLRFHTMATVVGIL